MDLIGTLYGNQQIDLLGSPSDDFYVMPEDTGEAFNPFHSGVVCHIETSHLIDDVNLKNVFYLKYNTAKIQHWTEKC